MSTDNSDTVADFDSDEQEDNPAANRHLHTFKGKRTHADRADPVRCDCGTLCMTERIYRAHYGQCETAQPPRVVYDD